MKTIRDDFAISRFAGNPKVASAMPNSHTFPIVLSGTYTVGSGGIYSTLTAAVADYNTSGLGGPVVFSLTDILYSASETFPISINLNPDAGSINTLTIRPASGVAATIIGTSGAGATSLIRLNGAKYVTFDGLNTGGSSLTIENTSLSSGTVVFWLSSNGVGLGASNNTIKNCGIKAGVAQNVSTTGTYGIIIAGSTLSTIHNSITAGDDNDNNTIQGNTFTKVRHGIFTRGGGPTNANTGTVISNNIFGPTAFGASEIGKTGVLVREEEGIQITGNEIRFVGGTFGNTSAGDDHSGITFGINASWVPATVYVKNAIVTNNHIHDIVDERGFSAVGIGIGVADGSNPTNNLIANNMIYNIRANGNGSDQAIGIGLRAANGDKVVFNSIYMTGETDPVNPDEITEVGNFGISISSISVSNPLIEDNIVYMDLTSSSDITLQNACINVPASFAWGTGSSDYNDFYITPANTQSNIGCVGGDNGTFYLTLAAWQGAIAQDPNSLTVAPVFTSAFDLHLTPDNEALDNMGIPAGNITTDIDGDQRSLTAPDMGVDEFTIGCSTIVTSANNNGAGTLRDIILCAPSGSTITFSLGVPPQTITLTSGEIVINKNFVISGPGMTNLTISGNNTSRIFHLLPGHNFEIENISLKNANAVENGGALFVEGNLTLENVLLENNFENGTRKGMTIFTPALVTVNGDVQIKQ